MEYHEAVDIYPPLEGKEFDALVEDIRKNGLRVPILTYKGKILDGRNRSRACDVAGVEKRFEEWDGQGSLVDAVVSYNDARRHLDSGQRAVSGLKAEKLLAAEAKERQRLSAGRGQKGTQKIEYLKGEKGEAAEQAAKKVGGTNRQYIYDAKKVDEKAPALIKEVHEGRLALQDAKKVAILPDEVRGPTVREIVRAPTPEAKREIAREAVRQANPKNKRPLYELVYEGANKAARLVHDMNQLGGVCVIAEMEDWEPEQRQVVLDAVKRAAKALYDFHNELAEINERMCFDGEEEATDFQYPN